jgi:bifunctional NMN adenylyltransferase/nudix hydrolase
VIVSVYIGRFSPFHNGHAEVLNRARRKSDLVIVLVGSVNKAQNPKNPWSFDERADMINDYMKSNGAGCPVVIRGIRDFPYNDQRWIANVHNVINETLSGIKADKIELFITGADRDSSTFYLNFPDACGIQVLTDLKVFFSKVKLELWEEFQVEGRRITISPGNE